MKSDPANPKNEQIRKRHTLAVPIIPKSSPTVSRQVQSEFESLSPTENRVSRHHDLAEKECNLDIILEIKSEDFENEGVTFFSE